MSAGQMAMVIGAFMLFGTVTLNFQRTVFDNSNVMDSNTNMQSAITIARSMMAEIRQKPFDAGIIGKTVVRLSNLTSCGSGVGEYYPNFNDVDDYDGKTFVSPPLGTTPATTPRALWGTERDTILIRVQYVNQVNPDVVVGGVTWCKRITVTVRSGYSEYPLTMTHVVTYY